MPSRWQRGSRQIEYVGSEPGVASVGVSGTFPAVDTPAHRPGSQQNNAQLFVSWQRAGLVVKPPSEDLSRVLLYQIALYGLRRLVKNLSVTDEKSGLLKRSSYLDLLLAETKRAVQNASALSVLLMQFGRSSAMIKEYGEGAVAAAMEKVGQQFTANIRSNDLAFRYDTTTIAIILGDTAEKEGLMAIEKLRKTIAGVRIDTKDGSTGEAMEFSAGLAQAVVREGYDPIDIVTEVINRAEHALTVSLTHGPGKVVAEKEALAAGAVA